MHVPFNTILYIPFKQLLANSVLMQPEENGGSRVTTSLNSSALKPPDLCYIYILLMCAYIILNVCSVVQTQRNPQYYSRSWVFHSVARVTYIKTGMILNVNETYITSPLNMCAWIITDALLSAMVCSPPAEQPGVSVYLPQTARLLYCTLAAKLASSGMRSGYAHKQTSHTVHLSVRHGN